MVQKVQLCRNCAHEQDCVVSINSLLRSQETKHARAGELDYMRDRVIRSVV